MTIHSRGYASEKADEQREKCLNLFIEHLQLLCDRQSEILNCADYFFCPLPFAGCSWPYIGGDGPLCLGFLLLGWKDGLLIEICPDCKSEALVFFFGGSPLSGSCGWSGYCKTCGAAKTGKGSQHTPFVKRIEFIKKLRARLPERVSYIEDYEGSVFSFGGDGFQKTTKQRKLWRNSAKPVDLETLVAELTNGTGVPPASNYGGGRTSERGSDSTS